MILFSNVLLHRLRCTVNTRTTRFCGGNAGHLKDVFKDIDVDNDGSISVDELRIVVQKEGEREKTWHCSNRKSFVLVLAICFGV